MFGATRRTTWVFAALLVVAACTPGEGPKSIPLPTSPDTTTTSTTTTSTTTTTTTTTTIEPPRFEATIRRTTDGVPHISGRTLGDVAFGQGWVSADDYGCTLLDQILKVRGERSANLGPGAGGENIESDFAWRSLDLIGRATADFDTASPEVVEQFEAFVAGWNQHLADQGDSGLAGWCAEATWIRPIEPVEVYAYARSIALLASGARLLDFIASAQPPVDPEEVAEEAENALPGSPEAEPDPEPEGLRSALRDSDIEPPDFGSNAWAIGAQRTENGTGSLLVANPHFPWEGELRFAEVHLTVPGDVDIYGAQLAGLPGVGIGFTDGVAWSHTTSAGSRFTAYTLDLDPEDPTTYLVDGLPRAMTATEHTVEILRPDGTIDSESRTLYESDYGPIIDFPGLGWTETQAVTYRDANLDNDEFVEMYLDLIDVTDLDDLIETHRRHQAVPLFNTVAAGADGRTWYADTSATPNLSADAELQFVAKLLDGDPVTTLAFEAGVILLDGSDSRFQWEVVEGARDPGLVPFDEQPMVVRNDYVFNANDSYWVPSDEFTIREPFSIAHGERDVPLSMRTRQNAAVLSSDNSLQLAGDDGNWNSGELRSATFDNIAHNALLLRAPVVDACRANPLVEVDAVSFDDGTVAFEEEVVDLTAACDVLAGWDGRYDLDSPGAMLWRETMVRFPPGDRIDTGLLFGDPFLPDSPTTTPAQLADDVAPVLTALARAVQTVTTAGFDVDSVLGSAQFTERSGTRIPLHGGTNVDGTTNIVQWSDGNNSSSEPQPVRGEQVSPRSALRGEGYPVNFGTSFVMVVDFTSGGPEAWAILTYGQTGDRESPVFDTQTVRFSEKNWRPVLFTDDAIAIDPALVERTVILP